MNEQLKRLYQTVILENNNHPFHFEKREDATYIVEAYNQICGDRFKIYFEVEDSKIAKVSFHGFGCAISKASTSIMLRYLDGKSLEEGMEIMKSFLEVIKTEGKLEGDISEDFRAFSAAKSFPGRLKCATLSWEEMNTFFNNQKNQ